MLHIRPSLDSDIDPITAIYAHYVQNSTATFEAEVPSNLDMAARRADVLAKSMPYLVLTEGGTVMGFTVFLVKIQFICIQLQQAKVGVNGYWQNCLRS
jgi:L-amino acid N-acyltransferase YncA